MDLLDPPARLTALNLKIDSALLEQALSHRINLAQAAEDGVRRALVEAWRADNADAIHRANTWLQVHGPPLKPLV